MFSKPRSQHLKRSDMTVMLEENQVGRLASLWRGLRTPLERGKMLKKPGNFFIQGLLTGVSVLTLSIALLATGAVRFGWLHVLKRQ